MPRSIFQFWKAQGVLSLAVGSAAATWFGCSSKDAPPEATDATTRQVLGPSACDINAPFDPPQAAFTGARIANSLALSADGLTAYVATKSSPSAVYAVNFTHRNSTLDPFATLSPVSALNTGYDDRVNWISPDGSVLYLTTLRPWTFDIARATWSTSGGYSAPSLLPSPINSGSFHDQDPYFLSLPAVPPSTPATNQLYFASESPSGVRELYVSNFDGTNYSTPVALSTINDAQAEDYRPVLSHDGLTIYFASTRLGIGSDTNGDIWMARRTAVGQPFAANTLTNLYGLNSSYMDFPVTLADDDCTLYFASAEETGGPTNVRLYRATRPAAAQSLVNTTIKILGTGSVNTAPFVCSSTCSAQGAPESSVVVQASGSARWRGSCTGQGGGQSSDGVVVFTNGGVCTVDFRSPGNGSSGSLCFTDQDCTTGFYCLSGKCSGNAVCDPDAPFGPISPVLDLDPTADGLTLSADELTAYVSRKDSTNYDIYQATRSSVSGQFVLSPTPLTNVNGPGDERAPWLSSDGQRLYFWKKTTLTSDGNLAMSSFSSGQFQAPVLTPFANLNSSHADEDPFLLADENTIFFVSDQPGGDRDLWMSTRTPSVPPIPPTGTFAAPTKLEVVNTPSDNDEERRPILTPDGLTLYFHSDRQGWNGDFDGDIWIAKRTTTTQNFGTPVLVDGLNSSQRDFPVALSKDSCTLYFASSWDTGGNYAGPFKLYRASRCVPNCAGLPGGTYDGCGSTCPYDGAEWTPDALSPKAWYVAEQSKVEVVDGRVRTWRDHRGNGPNVVQDIPGGRPKWDTTSLPTLKFEGGQLYQLANWSGAPAGTDAAFTVLAVLRALDTTGLPASARDTGVVSWWDSNGGGQAWAALKDENGETVLDLTRVYGLGFGQMYASSKGLGTDLHALAWRYSPDTQELSVAVDGVISSSSTMPSIAALPSMPLIIGAKSSLPTGMLRADISELVIVPSAVSDADLQSFTEYARIHWPSVPQPDTAGPCIAAGGGNAPDHKRCDDGNAATYGDECVGGACAGTVPRAGSPAELSPIAWYHANAQEVVLTDNGVSTWFDRTANHRDLLQAFYAGRPTLNLTGWNANKPTISFNNGVIWRNAWSGTPAGDDGSFSVLAVLKSNAAQNAGIASFWHGNGQGQVSCQLKNSSGTVLDLFRRDANGSTQDFMASADMGQIGHVAVWRYSPEELKLTLDGETVTATRPNSLISLGIDSFLVGATTYLPTGLFNGTIPELAVVAGSITDEQVATFREYALDEWGGLPLGGPGEDCAADSQCQEGYACGSGKCGGTGAVCGQCAPGLACNNGTCECEPSCAGKSCGDDPADGCGGTCAGYCADGEGDCLSDAECLTGSYCAPAVGARFGLPPGTNVCVPRICEDFDPGLPDCGVNDPACGECTHPPSTQCGDAIRDPDTEECDDGEDNDVDACRADCRVTDVPVEPLPRVEGERSSRSLDSGRHPLAAAEAATLMTYTEVGSVDQGLRGALFRYRGQPLSAFDLGDGAQPSESADPSVAAIGLRHFVAAWNDLGQGSLDIALRVVEAGDPPILGEVTLANSTTAGAQQNPDLLWTGTELVAAWSSELAITMRRFDSNLVATSEEQRLSLEGQFSDSVSLASFGDAWAAAWRTIDDDGAESIGVRAAAAYFSVGPFVPGAERERPALVELDDTHLLVVFSEGTDPLDTGTPSVTRLRGAILDAAAPGPTDSFPLEASVTAFSADELVGESRPTLARVGSSLYLGWETEAVVGDGNSSEVWLQELTWTPEAGLAYATEKPIPVTAGREDAQHAPAFAASSLLPEGALAIGWEQHSEAWPYGARPDVVFALRPVPFVTLP